MNDKRIQKWVLRGSNWEWNRFFRKSNCFSLCTVVTWGRGRKICIAWYSRASCCETWEIGNSGWNSTILNAKFVKSWISVASRVEFRKCFGCFFFAPTRNFIVCLRLSDVDKLLLWIVDSIFFFRFVSNFTKSSCFSFLTINPIN